MDSTDKILKSLKVPALFYKNSTIKPGKVVSTYIENIDSMLKEGRSIFFNLPDGVESSKLAVLVLRAAIKAGYLKSRYITPEDIAESKAESWEEGNRWHEYETCDLLVIDRIVFSTLDGFKIKTLYDLVERRILNIRSVILVSEEDANSNVPDRIKNLFNHAGLKLLKENR